MAAERPSGIPPGRMTRAGSGELEASRTAQEGANFEWHFGRVTSLSTFEIAATRMVTILWEEGGISSQQGDITDEQWEIFKLAFVNTGRDESYSCSALRRLASVLDSTIKGYTDQS